MSDALLSDEELVTLSAKKAVARDESEKKPKRAGFFRGLIEALHHSRRLQAQSIIHQYRHLIDEKWHELDSESDIGRRDNVGE
jgi:hypothetical protein